MLYSIECRVCNVLCTVQYTTVNSVHHTVDRVNGLDGVVLLVPHLYCIVVPIFRYSTAGASYGSVSFVYVATRRIVYGTVVRCTCTCYHKWYSTVNPTVNSCLSVPCMA